MTLSPGPSYALCTDADDARQLTDGVTGGADWTNKSTVGWSWPAGPVTLTIDLGLVEPIGEVRICSIGGGRAGVFYPAAIIVLVSDDGRRYRVAGAVNSFGLAQDRESAGAAPKAPYTFTVGPMQTRGRYVGLLIEPDGAYAFVDELEVLRGRHRPAEVQFAVENDWSLAEASRVLPVIHRRAAAQAVLEAIRRAGDQPGPGDFAERLTRLRAALGASKSLYDEKEVERITVELYQLRGIRLAGSGPHRLRWAVVNPMSRLAPAEDLAASGASSDGLELRCWQGEYESAAVNLLNCGPTALHLTARIGGPEVAGTTQPAWAAGFTLRQAVTVHSRSCGPTGDALAKLRDGAFTLGAGQTGQLWLTFHDRTLRPGLHHFALRLSATDEQNRATLADIAIPGRLQVDPIEFPAHPTLKSVNWAYLQRAPILRRATGAALQDLREHYINVRVLQPWGDRSELPLPQPDRDGRVRVDFSGHAEALRRHADAEQYLFFWNCTPQEPNLANLPPWMSPAWKRAMRTWLREWVGFLGRGGVGYERFAMHPFDEYIGDEFYQLARFIKEEVDPRIRIFANSRGGEDGAQLLRVAPYVDLWSLPDVPPEATLSPVEQDLRKTAQVWTYACDGPSKSLAPYGYYRLQAWRAFARGESGCGFWSYADPGAADVNPWDDTHRGVGPFGVVYPVDGCPVSCADDALIPSRRWEAWREGIEDFEYLVRTRAAVDAARRAGRSRDAARAQRVLDRAVRQVVRNSGDASAVYRARRELVEELLRHAQPG